MKPKIRLPIVSILLVVLFFIFAALLVFHLNASSLYFLETTLFFQLLSTTVILVISVVLPSLIFGSILIYLVGGFKFQTRKIVFKIADNIQRLHPLIWVLTVLFISRLLAYFSNGFFPQGSMLGFAVWALALRGTLYFFSVMGDEIWDSIYNQNYHVKILGISNKDFFLHLVLPSTLRPLLECMGRIALFTLMDGVSVFLLGGGGTMFFPWLDNAATDLASYLFFLLGNGFSFDTSPFLLLALILWGLSWISQVLSKRSHR